MKNKIFFPILTVAAFLLAFGYIPPFKKTVRGIFDGNLLASTGGGKGQNKSANRKPVTFVENVSVTSVDSAKKTLKGVGQAGSHTARDFMYQELDYDFSNAVIEDKNGNSKTADDISAAKRVYIHGMNNQDGTFEITKVVIVEPE